MINIFHMLMRDFSLWFSYLEMLLSVPWLTQLCFLKKINWWINETEMEKTATKLLFLLIELLMVSSFANSRILQQTTICVNFFLAVLHGLFFPIATCFCLRLWPIYQYKTVQTEMMRALSGSTLWDQNSMN